MARTPNADYRNQAIGAAAYAQPVASYETIPALEHIYLEYCSPDLRGSHPRMLLGEHRVKAEAQACEHHSYAPADAAG